MHFHKWFFSHKLVPDKYADFAVLIDWDECRCGEVRNYTEISGYECSVKGCKRERRNLRENSCCYIHGNEKIAEDA